MLSGLCQKLVLNAFKGGCGCSEAGGCNAVNPRREGACTTLEQTIDV
jgi:hypothetical protein